MKSNPEMIHPNVKNLYIYKPDNCYTKKIFQDGLLWSSKPKHFNDPFDCDLEVTKGITEDDVMEDGKFKPAVRELIDKAIEAEINANKNSGVICLSEINDSILMWSHYAHNHKGICIEFDRRPGNPLGDPDICKPVEYGFDYPVIDFGKMFRDRDGKTLELMMRYKANCWEYEKEWRVIMNQGDKQWPLARVGRISKVIFGIQTPADFRNFIKELCDTKKIRTVEAVKAPMEFRILIPD